MKASRGLALLLFAFLLFSSSFARRLSSATGQETAIFDTPPPDLTVATPQPATTIATPPLATTIASPVLPDSYSSPVPATTIASSVLEDSCCSPVSPSPASPTLLTRLGVGFAVGVVAVAVAVAVLLIYCGKKNRQPLVPTPSAPHSSGMRIFTLDEINQCTNNFHTKIGEGTFGLVYHGRLSKEKEVAVKKLKGGDEQNNFGLETEVENLRRAHHKHVVSLVGYCKAESQCFLVYEYVPKKTLDFHLYGHGDGRQTLDWPTRLKIALGSAKGLAYLHEDCHPKIIHRDIKANNILLDSRFEAKIADFGLAKCIPESKSHVSTMPKGTPAYLDPEYSSTRKLTEKSDSYSFGVVLLELITGRKPTICAGSGECLVDWARSHLTRCLEARNFDSIADSRLGNNYERDEMARMVVCADACVRQSAKDRPKMSEVVRALEGYLPQRRPGESSDCGTSQALEMFRKILLASPGHGRGHDGEPTSGSSSAGPSRLTTQDLPMGRMQRDGQGFDGVSRSSLL